MLSSLTHSQTLILKGCFLLVPQTQFIGLFIHAGKLKFYCMHSAMG